MSMNVKIGFTISNSQITLVPDVCVTSIAPIWPVHAVSTVSRENIYSKSEMVLLYLTCQNNHLISWLSKTIFIDLGSLEIVIS